MSVITLDEQTVQEAVYGGAILGGGGGGWIKDGLSKGKLALEVGAPTLKTVDACSDNDIAACVALVGAPAAKEQYVDASQLFSTVELLDKNYPGTISGLITNENGASTTINGWLQSALTGLPVIDAPCNGRAHPTASMGSLNLTELPDYVSYQAAAGGKGMRSIEAFVSGHINYTSNVIRSLSVEAGGMVGVARNPISIRYLKEHAAVGGIQQAIALGKAYLKEKEAINRIEVVAEKLQGRIIKVGTVQHCTIVTEGGFDTGTVYVDDLELTFWNEYMTAEWNGERKATFPDLIMTFDAETGMPLVSAEITKNRKVAVLVVPKESLLLSATMSNPKLLKTIETIVKKQIVY